ncbi:Mu-like prophage major head subunit gpT family protein [Propionivibrio sp.]|uniref:Mu-like prophage major head subunit gpT family protein n=1 Tax=Propionivibrio sp. TaxID=2212460 RepID=UPI003BF01B24
MKSMFKFLAVAVSALLAVVCLPAFASPSPGNDLLLFAFGGMIVNKDTLSSLFISLKTTFNNAFSTAESQWQKIAMKVPSSTGQNDYLWLSKFPKMKKWIGDKNVKALEAAKYTIVNDDWEATVEVDRNDIDDDNLGIYGPQAQMAGESAKQLPDEIVADLVNNSFVAKGFDGQYFFDTDHLVAGASVSNKGTKALAISTVALAMASYGAYRTAMKKFKDDEGRPLAVAPNILLVPPALEDTANLLMTTDRLEDGKPNPYKGTATVVVEPRLTSDTAWFLLDTTKPVKPFIYQERKAPVFVQQTDPQAADVFNRKKFKFGAEARAAGGYGFWQLGFGSDGTT